MNEQTLAFFICSPSGRVGKTTLARLLADYFALGGRPFKVFDTDPHESELAHRFPDQAVLADLGKIQGQMNLFDGILVDDRTTKIVDLWHRSYDTFFNLVEQIDFVAEAERLGIRPVFVFIADPSVRSIEAASAIARRWPDAMLIITHNEGAASLGPDVLDELARYPSTRTFEIPALDSILRGVMDKPGFSLSRFIVAPPSGMSIVVRAGLRAWLSRVFAQFQNFELRLAMDGARYLR